MTDQQANNFSFFWHDYETWGVDPRVDRACQFAGIRTDFDLNPIAEPVMLYCKPTTDFIPHPDAALITGITPQLAFEEGKNEADFFQHINSLFSQAGTCAVGYNNLRFDDEVTRFGFYRNFIDPYAREWQQNNSRWDLIDLIRMTYALRPEGINWPTKEDGSPSFRLEDLTAANSIEQEGAHDALVDVKATISIAKLIKEKQPRLFGFYFKLRHKQVAASQLKVTSTLDSRPIVLHISGMFPSNQGCLSPIMALATNPNNNNEIISYDLRKNPQKMLAMSPEEIQADLYKPNKKRLAGEERLGLKGIHINKVPALAPLNTLDETVSEKWEINWEEIKQHQQMLIDNPQFIQTLIDSYKIEREFNERDADVALYEQFISNSDRKLCDEILSRSPNQLDDWQPPFDDERLITLFKRYRARNWPELLNETELQQWQAFCHTRIINGEFGNNFTITDAEKRLTQLSEQNISEKQQNTLKKLIIWIDQL